VKTTRGHRNSDQRATQIKVFKFNIGVNGRFGKKRIYNSTQLDIFALVDLNSRQIAYLPYSNAKSTMNFRVPEFRGTYWDEQAHKNKELVTRLKVEGKMPAEIAVITGLKLSNVYKFSANVSIKQKGSHQGTYFDDLTLEGCLKKMGL
jgi:hypothetical protein